jgi:hypothetical protein
MTPMATHSAAARCSVVNRDSVSGCLFTQRAMSSATRIVAGTSAPVKETRPIVIRSATMVTHVRIAKRTMATSNPRVGLGIAPASGRSSIRDRLEASATPTPPTHSNSTRIPGNNSRSARRRLGETTSPYSTFREDGTSQSVQLADPWRASPVVRRAPYSFATI